MTLTNTTSKTLFITGVSSGFGLALAQQALLAGHRVIGTVRNEEARLAFETLQPGRAFGRILDVSDAGAIGAVAMEVERTLGVIDVLVNNAGYGHEGVLEESPLDELRRQFDVDSAAPPAHLLLGSDGLAIVRAKLAALSDQIDAWETLSLSTDH